MSNFIGDNSALSPGWETQVPIYQVTRDVQPPTRARYRTEKPFTTMADNDCWQYAERPYQRGETVQTTSWPHPSFRPLNCSAEKVLAFFNGAMKSRLTRSPWHDGRVRLDNGISDAPSQIDIARRGGLTPTPRHAGPSTASHGRKGGRGPERRAS
jgi:hypothetical protein